MSSVASETLLSPTVRIAESTRAETYRPDIDGLRAIAIMGVVVYHAGASWLPGGFAGVDVFFVISGFLISGIIVRHLQRGTFTFTDFYARRIRRIFPTLCLMLLTVWALSWPVLLWDEYQLLGKHVMAGGGFSVNLVLYNDFNLYFGATTTPLIHLWSLGVEEQFYILWPLFFVLLWRFGKLRLVALVNVALLSFGLNILALKGDQTAAFYLPTSRMWELAIGACMALVASGLGPSWTRATGVSKPAIWFNALRSQSNTWGCLGIALIGASFFVLQDHWAFPGWWALLPCIGSGLLLAAGPDAWINRNTLACAPMIFIGQISYPLYLWHWPLLSLGRILKGTALSAMEAGGLVCIAVILATMTYRWIELPIRHSPRPSGWTPRLLAGMCVIAVLGCLTQTGALHARSEKYALDPFIRASRQDWLTGQETSWTWYTGKPLWLGQGAHRTLFVGDSNMQQYYPRIAQLYEEYPENRRGAVFQVMAGCAPAMDTVVSTMDNEFAGSACRAFLKEFQANAQRPDIDTVVIAALWRLYLAANWDDFSQTPLRPDAGQVVADLGNTIADLVRRGKKVYVVLNIPVSRKFDPRHMIHRSLTSEGFTLEVHAPTREEMAGTTGAVNELIRDVASRAGAEVIDPTPTLCDSERCPALMRNGEPMYRDHAHLKPSYVRHHVTFLDRTVIPAATNSVASRDIAQSNVNDDEHGS
jgi:peptidoglycan/LPS O-acetylase OafA/YrhL